MIAKNKPTIFKLSLGINKLSEVFGLKKEDLVKNFKDARVMSRFAELHAAILYNFKKCENLNEPNKDGDLEHLLGEIYISVKCLHKNIKFQASKFIGSKRHCNQQNLIDSIQAVDFYVIVDIKNFPELLFIPLKRQDLIEKVNKKIITISGVSYEKFYKKLINLKEFKLQNINTDELITRYYKNNIIVLSQNYGKINSISKTTSFASG